MDTNDADLIRGGRVRLVSDDQAANLREAKETREYLDRLLAETNVCTCPGSREYDRIDAEWAAREEESQGPDDYPGWARD